MAEIEARSGTDFLNHRMASFLIWRVPALVMIATAFAPMGDAGRGLVWALCLGTFGVGCIANALRCGRLHCYLTGPFFLLLAIASLVHGFDVWRVGSNGWLWIGSVTLLGGAFLTYVPEWIWGRYARPSSGGVLS